MIEDLISFLNSSPTPWHAVEEIRNKLLAAHFIELSDQDIWDSIKPAQSYFVIRNGSSLCAFITPHRLPRQVRLLASHTDSPGFKLKPIPEIRKHQAILLGVEIYGSPLLSSWFNRDLGIAGRIIVKTTEGKIVKKLIRMDEYPVTIPQLAIHLDREVNEKGLQINKQEHLNAIAGLEKSFPQNVPILETLLLKEALSDKIIGHDLFLFPIEKAKLTGHEHAFLSSYRIDSLVSVHAALQALIQDTTPLQDAIKMVIFWDNEEIGSHTAQGAQSPFFTQIIERIMTKLHATKEELFCLINRSTCISIDLAHALHPNYPEKHDPSHQPLLGAGVVLKNNAAHRYATNSHSSYPLQLTASLHNIPLQSFVSRNDLPCGTTIGPIHSSLTGMQTVDIGCAQLSMHSCRELIACQDYLDLYQLLFSSLGDSVGAPPQTPPKG